MTKLEVCCYSVDCALTAEQAGADRVELCASRRRGITQAMAPQLARESDDSGASMFALGVVTFAIAK